MAQAADFRRVVLVEDDAAIRTFVAMALEEQPIRLDLCPTLGDARRCLAQEPEPALVLLDMMLPDGSGYDLLTDTALRRRLAGTRWAVFSAGVTAAVRAAMPALSITQVLNKPVSLADLIACVQAAVQGRPAEPVPAMPADGAWRDQAGPDDPSGADGSPLARESATRRYFEGNEGLFADMQRRAVQQFPHDVRAGDTALSVGDYPAIRRVAHNLKTVLRMLGHPDAGVQAQALEAAAERAAGADCSAHWSALRPLLCRLAEPSPSGVR